MVAFIGAVDACNALQDFIFDRSGAVPDDTREKLRDYLKERSAVVAVTNALELIFARQVRHADIPEELSEWAAAAAAMTEDMGFHEMDKASRGSLIARVLRGLPLVDGEHPEPVAAALAIADPPDEAEPQDTGWPAVSEAAA